MVWTVNRRFKGGEEFMFGGHVCRIVAITEKGLDYSLAEVEVLKLVPDAFGYLNGVLIPVPPLRWRGELIALREEARHA